MNKYERISVPSLSLKSIRLHKAMDWDSSREYDSRTFSEDCNLHGASRRSDDHPSATQDERGFLRDLSGHNGDDDDDQSIDNADMDLIEQIFEGKPPRQPTYQGRGSSRRATHQTDENSGKVLWLWVIVFRYNPLVFEQLVGFCFADMLSLVLTLPLRIL